MKLLRRQLPDPKQVMGAMRRPKMDSEALRLAALLLAAVLVATLLGVVVFFSVA